MKDLKCLDPKPNNDKKEPTIRFSKFAEGRNYPGPEPDFNNIPLIAQAILKIYNDFK